MCPRDEQQLLKTSDADVLSYRKNLKKTGVLKTGLAKKSLHSTTWQFETKKVIQSPIKSCLSEDRL